MLVQWLLTIALTAQITLGSMQGFLLLAKLHQAQIALAQEQEQIRFLVVYFRSMLHDALMPAQICGAAITQDNPLASMKKRPDSILEVMRCRQDGRNSKVIAQRFFLLDAESKRGLTLFVQEGDHRREALTGGLQLLSLKFCTKTVSNMDCRAAEAIQDWNEVGAVEFNLQFLPNAAMDKMVTLHNHHRWQFTLKLGAIT